jgi:hypothetical protein
LFVCWFVCTFLNGFVWQAQAYISLAQRAAVAGAAAGSAAGEDVFIITMKPIDDGWEMLHLAGSSAYQVWLMCRFFWSTCWQHCRCVDALVPGLLQAQAHIRCWQHCRRRATASECLLLHLAGACTCAGGLPMPICHCQPHQAPFLSTATAIATACKASHAQCGKPTTCLLTLRLCFWLLSALVSSVALPLQAAGYELGPMPEGKEALLTRRLLLLCRLLILPVCVFFVVCRASQEAGYDLGPLPEGKDALAGLGEALLTHRLLLLCMCSCLQEAGFDLGVLCRYKEVSAE